MTIKELLEKIGLSFDDEQAAENFLMQPEIKEFLLTRYKEDHSLKQKPVTIEDFIKEEQIKDSVESINTTTAMIRYPGDSSMSDLDRIEAKEKAFENQVNLHIFSLQNGKMNHPYCFMIDKNFIEINNIGEFYFEGLEDVGLHYNEETNAIEGTPNQSGDFKILWHYKAKDASVDRPMLKKEITLIINADPRSLWNNIPTPSDILFYKPDSARNYVKAESTKGFLGFGKKERKDMVAASQRGRSHAHEGKPRDDDFTLLFDEESEWYIMSVADGAGSVEYSRRGAEIACQTVLEVCQDKLHLMSKDLEILIGDYNKNDSPENRKKVGDQIYMILGGAIFEAYKRIKEEANNINGSLRDFSTTLLLTICKKYRFGWFIASFWVGDGGIGIYNKEKQFLKIMGEADGGEFAGQTRFLTMPEIIQSSDEIYRRLRFEIVDDFTALILMTDGITDPKFETDANLMRIEKWNDLWNDLNNEVQFKNDFDCSEQLLNWLDFWSQGNHDDRTIAILY